MTAITAMRHLEEMFPRLDAEVIGDVRAQAESTEHAVELLLQLETSFPTLQPQQQQEEQQQPQQQHHGRQAKARSVLPLSRLLLDQNRTQSGNGRETNASHIVDVATVMKILGGAVEGEDEDEVYMNASALQHFLSSTENLPIKTRWENCGANNPNSDLSLDKEIQKALDNGQPLSDAAFERVEQQLALYKGKGKDCGFSDGILKTLMSPLAALKNKEGQTADTKYFSSWKDGQPHNLWNDLPASQTGLKKDGTPDLRTKAGQQRQEKTFARDTGFTAEKKADLRTHYGRSYGVDKSEMSSAQTGLKKDGTRDLRTTKGKALAAEAAKKALKAEEKFLATEEQASSSAQMRFQPAPSVAPCHSAAMTGHAETVYEYFQRRGLTDDAGLRMNGMPDMRTTTGREMARQSHC